MQLFDDEFKAFVSDHSADDTGRLRLKYAGKGDVYYEAISQIELRRKAPLKFIDPATGVDYRPLWLPAAVSVEQSSSAAMARFHASLLGDARNILDMTMGMGLDASTFARLLPQAQVTAVEMSERLVEFARMNYADLPNLTIVHGDSMVFLAEHSGMFDAIFADPVRRNADGDRVADIHDCTPDISTLITPDSLPAPLMLVKLSPMLDITDTLRRLPHIADIYVVEERGECREILIRLTRDAISAEASIHAVNLTADRTFTFTTADEADASIAFAAPREGEYLYEPSAAVMKAGPFRLLSQRFNASAIAPNTHIYTSKEALPEFPGRAYTIRSVMSYSSSVIKRLAKERVEASVAARNFVVDASTLRNRLRARENPKMRLIGVTDADYKPLLLLVEAVQLPAIAEL